MNEFGWSHCWNRTGHEILGISRHGDVRKTVFSGRALHGVFKIGHVKAPGPKGGSGIDRRDFSPVENLVDFRHGCGFGASSPDQVVDGRKTVPGDENSGICFLRKRKNPCAFFDKFRTVFDDIE
jgi:hypothetical protein